MKRFSYNNPNLYMICTFPFYNINIDNYPAIKNYLLSFGYERLEQSGKTYEINGTTIKSRKKTTNKWFETQDCINYADDFMQQKLVYTPVNSEYRFAMVPENIYFPNSLFMITGEKIKYLCALFNSKIYRFYLHIMFSNGKYAYGSSSFFSSLPIRIFENSEKIEKLVDLITTDYSNEIYEKINNLFYESYQITAEERDYIESVIFD